MARVGAGGRQLKAVRAAGRQHPGAHRAAHHESHKVRLSS